MDEFFIIFFGDMSPSLTNKDLLMIKLYMPTITKEDLQTVFNCLVEDDLTPNYYMEKFSSILKKEMAVKNIALISSYGQSLDIIFSYLNIEPGDEVIIPASIDVSLLYSINKNRVKPVVVDVEQNSLLPNPDKIEKYINKNTRGIIISQRFGIPNDLSLYKSFGIPLIEDCGGSFLSSINNIKLGGFGNFSMVSLADSSVITTGSGAILGSNENAFGKLIRDFKEKWISSDIFMSNLNAALGVAQLKNLHKNMENRKKLTSYYDRAVADSGGYFIDRYDNQELILTKYMVASNTPFDEIKRFFSKYKVTIERAFPNPIHRVLELDVKRYRNFESLSHKAILLPFYPKLSKEEIETIVKCIKAIL